MLHPPAVVEGFLLGALKALPKPRARKGLSEEEAGLALFLKRMTQTAEACEQAQSG